MHRSITATLLASCLAAQAPPKPAAELVATLAETEGHVSRIAFSPDGSFLATAGHDCTVRVFDTTGYKERMRLKTNKSQQLALAISPDGKSLAAAGDFSIRVWQVKKLPKKKSKKTWKHDDIRIKGGPRGFGATAWDLAFSHDSKILAVATFNGDAQLFGARGWKPLATLGGHSPVADGNNLVEFVDFSPDGKQVVAGGKTDATRVYARNKRKKTWKIIGTFPEADNGKAAHRMCARFSPNGDLLVIGGTDGKLQVIKTDDWKVAHTITAHPGSFLSAAVFTADGTHLYTSGDEIKLWDTDTWETVLEIAAPAHTHALSLSTDGQFLAAAATEDKVRIYRVAEQR